jgi:hypothetical protein
MSDAARILLWGGRGAGKSGFVGALWNAGGDDVGGHWCISPGDLHDAATKNYLIEAHASLRDGHTRATMPATEYPYLRMTVRRWVSGSPRDALDLAFKDPAGEYADDPLRARQQGAPLLAELLDASGVVWLFDAVAEHPPDLGRVVRQLGSLRERAGGRPVHTPVAFCLSRTDLLGDEVRASVERDPYAALRSCLGDDVMSQLEGTFTNRRFFAISSRGSRPGRVEPSGLNDVLDWMHANQRRRRMAALGTRWGRQAAVAAVLAIALLWAGRVVNGYRNGVVSPELDQQTQQTLGRLELAELLYGQGDADSAFAVLKDAQLPPRHERALELDTVLTFIAYQVGGARMLAGGTADSALAVTVERAERAMRSLREPAALARLRYVHAEACMLRGCGSRPIRESLEYVVEHAQDAQLVRKAREHLATLRS